MLFPPRYIPTLFLEHQPVPYTKCLTIKSTGEYSEVAMPKYRTPQEFKLSSILNSTYMLYATAEVLESMMSHTFFDIAMT